MLGETWVLRVTLQCIEERGFVLYRGYGAGSIGSGAVRLCRRTARAEGERLALWLVVVWAGSTSRFVGDVFITS